MPRVDYEALEARRQARHDRGADSDDLTVVRDDDDNDEEENEAVIDDSIEVSIRRATTTMFQHVLIFNQGAAESL